MQASGNVSSEPNLSQNDILNAIFQIQFIWYAIIISFSLWYLISLSNSPNGSKYIYIDLIIASIFGGFTVVCTKVISSFIVNLDFISIIMLPITHILSIILIATAVLQIRFLNKSLANFDSTQVIPTNFVLFTVFSISTSSILFHDMDRSSPSAIIGIKFRF